MLTIGLIGGIASGKSEVASLFAERGATILDADLAGHEVLREPHVIEQLTHRWGPAILNAGGEIDRRAVAAIVFAPEGESDRQFLNQVTHPRIAVRLAEQLRTLRCDRCPAAILDAALLLEAGWDSLCDEVVFVDVPEEVRRLRARSRGWDDVELVRREQSQLPISEKKRRATVLIDNGGTREELAAQVAELWQSWIARGDVTIKT